MQRPPHESYVESDSDNDSDEEGKNGNVEVPHSEVARLASRPLVRMLASSSSEDEGEEEASNVSMSETEQIQAECSTMVKLLKNLEKEEHDLQCELRILAREAVLCGFTPNVVEPPAPKRRRTAGGAKKKEDS